MPERILFVNLPTDGSYPLGAVLLASHVRARVPRTVQSILDLSLLPPGQRRQSLKRAILDFRPSVVAFSWRDIVRFATHDHDLGLGALLWRLYPRGLGRKASPPRLASRILGLSDEALHVNCEMIGETRSSSPGLRVVLGGAAPTLFGEWLKRRLPAGLPIVTGEGEGPLEALARSESLTWPSLGSALRDRDSRPFSLRTDMASYARPEPRHIASILPAHRAYLRRPLPVQSSRGCPQVCRLDPCTALEGRGIRFRPPEDVCEEMRAYRDGWGVKSFSFVDSHLLGTEPSAAHGAAVLEAVLGAGGGLRWTGRLCLDHMGPDLARLAVRTGLLDFDLELAARSLGLARGPCEGGDPSATLRGLQSLASAGFKGRIRLFLTLNLPGETWESLKDISEIVREASAIVGENRLIPVIRLLWIQPGTQIEQELTREGYLPADYDPLVLDPASLGTFLYNPGHLGRRIAEALMEAWDQGYREEAGRVALGRLMEGGRDQTPRAGSDSRGASASRGGSARTEGPGGSRGRSPG